MDKMAQRTVDVLVTTPSIHLSAHCQHIQTKIYRDGAKHALVNIKRHGAQFTLSNI